MCERREGRTDERNNVTDLNYWPWGPMKKLAQVITHRLKDGGGTENQLTSFYYDLMGRPQTTVFPDGTSEISLYDLGQFKTWRTRKNQVKTINYDARGRENSHSWNGQVDYQDYGNLTTGAFGYDGRGFASSVQHKATGSGDIFAARTYYRDNRDRITSFRKGVNPGSNPMENGRGDKFVYDNEGQLIDAWYNALNPDGSASNWARKDHFVYDALGNRSGSNNNVASRNSGSVPISFNRRDNGLNQYTGWTPSAITFDDTFYAAPGNGVMMQEGYITASYNALNQPIAIWSPTYAGTPNFVWFGFDPLGRCVKRWVGESGDVYSNPATYFHYEGWNLLQEGNNAWGPARIYIHGNRVDEIVASFNTWTGEYAYHHYDARGHCTLLTDRSGNILEQYEYDAFGQPYFFSSFGQPLTTGSAYGNRFLFTGREWLSDLRIYDFRNRHYQPELGRFLQPDPIQFAAGDYNLYRYCHNDPVNKSDAFGLRDVDVYIWQMKISHMSVGHVMITEHNSQTVLLSQFPHQAGAPSTPRGPNVKLSFEDTHKEEGRKPDKVMTVYVPDDKTFDGAVKDHTERKFWDTKPSKSDETHCSRAAYDALKSGGVPLSGQDKGQILPGTLKRLLEKSIPGKPIEKKDK